MLVNELGKLGVKLRHKKRPDSFASWQMKCRRTKPSICTPPFGNGLYCLHRPFFTECEKRYSIQKGGIFMRYFKVDVQKEPSEYGFMPAMQMYLVEGLEKKR